MVNEHWLLTMRGSVIEYHPPPSLGPMLLALKLLTLVGPPSWNRSENLVFPGPNAHSKPERAAKDTDFVQPDQVNIINRKNGATANVPLHDPTPSTPAPLPRPCKS